MSKKRELAGLDEHFFEKYTSPVKRHSRKTDRWGFSSDPTAPLKKKRKVYSLATQEVPVYGRLVKSQEGMGIAPVLKLPIDDFKRYHNNECDLCGFGGRLVLCSSCTLSFHYRCLKDYIQEDTLLQSTKDENWCCAYCVAEREGVSPHMGQECARKIAERMNDVKKSSKASVSDAKPAAALMPAASAREEHPTSVLDSSLRTKGPGSSSEKATCPISPGIEDLHIAESSNNPGTRYEGDRDPDREIAVATDDANEEGKTPAAYDNDYGFGHSAGSVGETFESGSSTTTHNIPIKGILAESSPCLLRGSLKIGTAVRVPGDGSFQNFLAESHCSLGTQEIESGNETTDDEIVQSSEDSTIISTVQRPAKNRNLDEVYEDATACADRANARAKFLYDFLCSLMANAGIAWCLCAGNLLSEYQPLHGNGPLFMEWTMLFGLSGHLFHCVWHTTTCPHTIKAAVPQLVLYPMFLLWRNSPGELTWLDVVVKLWSFRDAAVATSGLVFVLALTPLGKLLSSIKELRLVLMFGLDFAIQTFL